MAKTKPFAQAAQARLAKTMLLSMPRATVEELALRLHLSLDALRRGKGNITHAQGVIEAVILTRLLFENGYGATTLDRLAAAERELARVFNCGRSAGIWHLDGPGFELIAEIVTIHDRQLQKAPLWALREASNRLEWFKAGEPEQKTRPPACAKGG
jgi:hypothetical protein